MSGGAHFVTLTAVTSAVILLKALVPTLQTFNGAFLLIPVLVIAWVSGWRMAVIAIVAVTAAFFFSSPSSEIDRYLSSAFFAAECGIVVYLLHRRGWKDAQTIIQHDKTDRNKDEFMATLSHELRNHLSPLSMVASLLHQRATKANDPTLTRAAEMVGRQTRVLTRLVEDMLDLTRIGRGMIDLERTVFDARTCVQNALEVCGPMAEDKSIQVTLDISPEPVAVNGDETRICQVFTNILNNAVKYNHDRNGRIEAVLRPVPQDNEVEFRVTDNGIGIEPDQQPNVFDMFYSSSTRRQRFAGLGVGLTLVKRMVELHQGRVWVESEGKDKGTTVFVRLPLASTADLTPPPTPLAPVAGPSKSVLLVDDDCDSASALTTLLHMSGHTVEHVTTGAAALASAATPEVYLLDIGLTDMNGYDLCRRLKASHPAALFIAMTGHVRPQDQERARQAGFDAHLPKPVDFDRLQTLLNGVST